MRNVIVLGSGRSGTSMVAGTLAQSGYFMGRHLSQEVESNPMTNFEDIEVNRINEQLLAKVVPARPKLVGNWLFRHYPVQWQRWLSCVPTGTHIPASPATIEKIKALVQTEPYCFKDPRFSYVLPVWKPFLKDTAFICIFRDPASTALSMLRLAQKASYLQNLSITFQQALNVWTLMYTHILDVHCQEGDWLFLHYNQALTSEGLDRLEAFTGAVADRSLPDVSLCQSISDEPVPKLSRDIYQRLCELAKYGETSSIISSAAAM